MCFVIWRLIQSDIPEAWFTGHGVSSKDLVKSVALRLPHDPYMHLILFQWKNLKTTPGWPAPFNQVGSRGLSLLVSDLDSELQRIRQEFPQLKVLHEPVTVRRKWGRTTSVLLVDPAGVFCDLIEIEKDSPYDPSRAKAPPQGARTWLHFMLNTENEHYPELSKFYRSFGTEHDNGVDFRPNVGFHPFGPQHFIKQMEDAFEYDLSKGIEGVNVGFLRKVSDPSSMHIELMGYPFGKCVFGHGQPQGSNDRVDSLSTGQGYRTLPPRPPGLRRASHGIVSRLKTMLGALPRLKQKGERFILRIREVNFLPCGDVLG